MSYQIIAPVVMPINASSYKDAVKQYVKLQRNAAINQLIVADQLTNNKMLANIKYYQVDNRRKFRADLVPTTLSELKGGVIGVMSNGPTVIGPTGRLSGISGTGFMPPPFGNPYPGPYSSMEPPPNMGGRYGRHGRPVLVGPGPGLIAPGYGPGLVAPGLVGPGLVGPGLVAPGLVAPGLVAPGLVGPGFGPGLVAPGFGGPIGPRLVGPGFGGPIGGPLTRFGSPTLGTCLPSGTKIIANTMILPTTVFPSGTVLPVGTIIDSATKLPNGIYLPRGTNIPRGTTWPPGAVMAPRTTVFGPVDPTLTVDVPTTTGGFIKFIYSSVIPVDAIFPEGTFISPVCNLTGNLSGDINDSVNIPKGFNLLTGNNISTLSKFPNGTIIQGSNINNTTIFDTGTVFPIGTIIKNGCVFPLGTNIPATAIFSLGTVIDIPTAMISLTIGADNIINSSYAPYIRLGPGSDLRNVTLPSGFKFIMGSVILINTTFTSTSTLTPGTEIMGPVSASPMTIVGEPLPLPIMTGYVPMRSFSPPLRRSGHRHRKHS